MLKFTEINIEEGMPSCMDALTALKNAITLCKTNKVSIALIIHGYGSSGKAARLE